MLMTSRCQDHPRTLMKGGNLLLLRLTWILQKMQEDTLDVNMYSNRNVKLDVSAHPFAHVFDASIPDPSSKPASPARRTKDYWEHMPELGVCVHHHLQPRKKFQDKPKDNMSFRAGTRRLTVCEPCQSQDEPKIMFMIWNLKTQLDFHFGGRDQPTLWTNQSKNLQKFWQQQRR